MSAGSDSVAGVLERAADRLEKPGAWTRGANARDASGLSMWSDRSSGDPVCWCAAGAICAEAGDDRFSIQVCDFLRGIVAGGGSIGAWNDAPERTQAEVVAKLREAAAKARSPQ